MKSWDHITKKKRASLLHTLGLKYTMYFTVYFIHLNTIQQKTTTSFYTLKNIQYSALEIILVVYNNHSYIILGQNNASFQKMPYYIY